MQLPLILVLIASLTLALQLSAGNSPLDPARSSTLVQASPKKQNKTGLAKLKKLNPWRLFQRLDALAGDASIRLSSGLAVPEAEKIENSSAVRLRQPSPER